jgi:hypothetical protein
VVVVGVVVVVVVVVVGVVVELSICQPVFCPWLQPNGALSPRQPTLPPRSKPGATRPKLGEVVVLVVLVVPVLVVPVLVVPWPVSLPRP